MGPGASQPPQQPSQAQEPWWGHYTVAFFCLVAIVLGALDHFLAHDSWGGFNLLLIGAGLAGGGVTLGHYVGQQQALSK